MKIANATLALVFSFMVGCGGERASPGASAPDTTTGAPAPSDTAVTTWTAGTTERQRPAATPTLLTAVRTTRHGDFDRVVFVFRDAVPGYRIGFIDRPVRACGSGKPVALAGEDRLKLQLQPVRAHDETGQPSIDDRERTPDLPILKEMKLICDFEADVTWVLGLADATRYRARELTNPPRLVLDVRHP